MPVPGASTASALVVCVASLSGWCLWQRNCVEDALVPGDQVTSAAVQTQATQFGNHSFKASFVVINKQCSKEAVPSGIEHIVSSSHVSLDKVLEFFDVANLSFDKLYPSRFSGMEKIVSPLSMSIEKIVSPLSVTFQTEEYPSRFSIGKIVSPLSMNFQTVRGDQLQTSQGDAIVGTIHVHEQAAFTGLSSLMHLLGVAVVFDLASALPYALWFGVCCVVAARHGRPKQSHTSFALDTHAAGRPSVKPMFFQARAPSHVDDIEPIFEMSPTADRSDEFLDLSATEFLNLFSWTDLSDEFLAQIPATATGVAQCSPASFSSDHELQARINTIVGSHTECRNQCEEYNFQVHASMALRAAQERQQKRQPNTSYVTDWAEHARPSPAKSLSNIELAYCAHVALAAAKERTTPANSPAPSPEKSVSNFELQTIKHCAHFALAAAKERTTPAKSLAFDASPSPAKSVSNFEISYCAHVALAAAKERTTPANSPAPSPAKAVSNFELSYCAHVALAAAKERTTPAKSPALFYAHFDAYHEEDVAPCQLNLDAYHEDGLVPCQLNFAGDADTLVSQKDDQQTAIAMTGEELATEPTEEMLAAELAKTAAAELAACLSESAGAVAALSIVVAPDEVSDDAKKAQACPFDVSKIPSPTRNRARRQQMFAASSSIADSGDSELTTKLQSRRNVVDSEGTTWQKLPEASLTDAGNTDCEKSQSIACDAKNQEAWQSWSEGQATRMEGTGASSKEGFLVSRSEDSTTWRPKRKDFSSPGEKGAAYRMLQCSATPPHKQLSQGGRRGLPHGMTSQGKDVDSPEPAPSTEFFLYQ